MKQKTNKLNKRIFAVFLSLILLLPSFAVPVFADNGQVIVLPAGTTTDLPNNWGFVLARQTDNLSSQNGYYFGHIEGYWPSDAEARLAVYLDGTNLKVVVWTDYPFSASSTGSIYGFSSYNPSTPTGNYTYGTPSSVGSLYNGTSYRDGKYRIITTNFAVTDNWVSRIGYFNSLNDALDACVDYQPIELYNSVTIPAGYVAYIKTKSSTLSFNLDSTFTSYSSTLSAFTLNPWPNDNRKYGFSSALPSSNTVTFDSNFGTSIPWDVGEPRDLLRRSKNGYSIFEGLANQGQYLVIFNPYRWTTNYGTGVTTSVAPKDSVNGSIVFSNPSGFSLTEFRIYPLSDTFVLNPQGYSGLISGSEDDYQTEYTWQYDSETDTWGFVDQDGNAVDPQTGGTSTPVEEATIIDEVRSLGEVITNFLNTIVELLSKPVSHIQQLIQSGAAYMYSLSQLYSWLPPEVSNTIISALIVVITIGIFKAFL